MKRSGALTLRGSKSSGRAGLCMEGARLRYLESRSYLCVEFLDTVKQTFEPGLFLDTFGEYTSSFCRNSLIVAKV